MNHRPGIRRRRQLEFRACVERMPIDDRIRRRRRRRRHRRRVYNVGYPVYLYTRSTPNRPSGLCTHTNVPTIASPAIPLHTA